jgi:hypothetical protein
MNRILSNIRHIGVLAALALALISTQLVSADVSLPFADPSQCGTVASGTVSGNDLQTWVGAYDNVPAGATVTLKVTPKGQLIAVTGVVADANDPASLDMFVEQSPGVAMMATRTFSTRTTVVAGFEAVLAPGASANYTVSIRCGNGSDAAAQEAVFTDSRLNDYGAIGALYASDNEGIQIYGIDKSSSGWLAAQISTSALANLPAKPDENILVAGSEDGRFTLYKLTTGEYQANIGPDSNGKVQVTIFDNVPATHVYGYDYTV